jgi:hypothetical protein
MKPDIIIVALVAVLILVMAVLLVRERRKKEGMYGAWQGFVTCEGHGIFGYLDCLKHVIPGDVNAKNMCLEKHGCKMNTWGGVIGDRQDGGYIKDSRKPGQIPSRPGQIPSRPGQIPSRPGHIPPRPGQIPSRPVRIPGGNFVWNQS